MGRLQLAAEGAKTTVITTRNLKGFPPPLRYNKRLPLKTMAIIDMLYLNLFKTQYSAIFRQRYFPKFWIFSSGAIG